MRDDSNYSVICTLFKITFLGKWDKRGERPFLWPLTVFPDRTHILCILSSTVSPPALNSSAGTSLGRTCGFATCCLTDGTSNLWTKWWRLLLPMFLFNSFLFFIMVQVFTIPFPPVCDLCSFRQSFTSRWLDTLQTCTACIIQWKWLFNQAGGWKQARRAICSAAVSYLFISFIDSLQHLPDRSSPNLHGRYRTTTVDDQPEISFSIHRGTLLW